MKLSYFFLGVIFFLGVFLRFYQINNIPPGLYIDEASIGYNAKTILQAGQDEHGVYFPLFFKAFGEYKMPVYIYATSGAMAVFGKNEVAIRFTSALSGALTVLLIYFFLKKIIDLDKFKEQKTLKRYLPLTAAFLMATSSWHIHFSRGGFEVTLGILLYLAGFYLSLLFWERKKWIYIFGSMLLFLLTIYTYNTFRIITPLTLIFPLVFFLKKLPTERKKILFSAFLFLLLCLPIMQFSLTSEGAARFAQTSAFSEYKADTVLQKISIYPIVYLKNYLSFFSFDFLFNFGDGNGRHQVPGLGLLYRWQFPFLILGLGWFLKQKVSRLKYIVFGLILIAPIPASLVRPSPNSLRALLLVIPFTILISSGLFVALSNLKRFRKVLIILISIIVFYESSLYLHYYYFHYPKVNALDWGAGYKEIVQKASKYKKDYEYIVIDRNFDFFPIYFHFYDDSLKFISADLDWEKPKKWSKKRVLYIRPFYGKKSDPNIVDQVYLPGRDDIYAQFWKL